MKEITMVKDIVNMIDEEIKRKERLLAGADSQWSDRYKFQLKELEQIRKRTIRIMEDALKEDTMKYTIEYTDQEWIDMVHAGEIAIVEF